MYSYIHVSDFGMPYIRSIRRGEGEDRLGPQGAVLLSYELQIYGVYARP